MSKEITKIISTDFMETTLQALHTELEENKYVLPTASSTTLGGVKTTSKVTSNSGYTACPIISGVPYYKDTNTDTNNFVLQSASTTSNYRPLMLGYNNSTDKTTLEASVTNQVYATKYIYAQPSTGAIFANSFNGNLNGNATSATKLQTARTFQTNLASTSTASFDGTVNVTPGVKGILSISNGGTGQNSANSAANVFINSLATGGSVPQDNDYFISQYVNGGTTTTTYHRRPISTLWTYIKGKADSTYALSSHSHSYLPLSGGTITGGLTLSGSHAIRARHLDGSTDGFAGELYLNYNNPNAPIYLGNAGQYISSNGSYYTGTSNKTNSMSSTGFGNGNLTYLQTSGDFDGNTNWCHYIIANHGDGASYYHYTIGLPFWSVPIYQRQTGNTSSKSGWHTFYTSENITCGTWSLTPGSSSLASGSIYLQYE